MRILNALGLGNYWPDTPITFLMVSLAQQITQLTENGFSSEEVAEVRELMQRPEVRAAILLQAFSVPSEVISEVMNVSRQDLELARRIPEYRDLYAKWSIKIKELSGPDVYERLLPLAVYVQEKFLTDENTDAKTRKAIATEIADRVKGKPKQSMEVRSMNFNVAANTKQLDGEIQAVMDRIQQLEDQRTRQLQIKQAQYGND
jgi:hypothetical protein